MEEQRRKEDRQQCGNRSTPLPSLRGLRRDMALSQRRLAELAEVSVGTVRLLESGRRGSYPSTARKLAAALGVAPADLIREPRQE